MLIMLLTIHYIYNTVIFMDSIWNPWHGCKKYSEGCQNCYVYRRDESIGKDASETYKTAQFDKPVKRDRSGSYKIKSGTLMYCCMTSDFFIEEADMWRTDIWKIMRERSDMNFVIITKRIVRFYECIPDDWGAGYPNVEICCTVENARQAGIRLPVFAEIPAYRKSIICEPLLGKINIRPWLSKSIKRVVAGGESGDNARICDYDWILDIREQCAEMNVPFTFKQTGAKFLKDGRLYSIPRNLQMVQALKADINT